MHKSSKELRQPTLQQQNVVCGYLILDKSNKVVSEKITLEDAKAYVSARPYLRYESFELPNTRDKCDLDDVF